MNLDLNKVYPRIRMLIPSLTKGEKEVAEYFLRSKSVTDKTSIANMATTLSVSPALIVKTSKKLGYSGFKEIKNALISIQNEPDYSHMESLDSGDDCAQIVRKVLNNSISALQEVLSFSSVPNIEHAAKIILSSKKITIMAVGGTSVIAEDFHHKLLRIGIHSHVPKDYHMMIMSASLMSESDVVLVISHSGETIDLLDATTEVKTSGAKIIAITNNFNSLLSNISDCTIFAPASPEPILGKNGTARLVKLALIDCLYATIANMTEEYAMQSIIKTSSATKRLHKIG